MSEDGGRRVASSARAATVVVLLGLLGGLWTIASPIGSGPDDGFHLASIWCSPTAPADACDDLGGSFAVGKTFVIVPAEIGPQAHCYIEQTFDSAECQTDIARGELVRTLANDGLYPGLYHALLGVAVGDQPVNSALLARFLAWTMSMTLLAAAWWVLPRRLRPAQLVVLLVIAVPHGVFLWASTNPSGLVTAAVSAAWCAAVALAVADRDPADDPDEDPADDTAAAADDGPDRRRLVATVALLVVATVLAAGSRADGGLIVGIALASAVALCWRPGRPTRRVLAVGATAGGALLTSFLVLSLRADTPAGLVGQTTQAEATDRPGEMWNNLLELPYFISGNLGLANSGWLDVPMPRLVFVPILGLFAALTFLGLARTDLRKGVALICLLAGLLGLPLFLLWRGGYPVGFEIQPRYVLPLVPVLGLTALYWRRGSSIATLSIVQLTTVIALVTVAHAAALHATIRRYVTGVDVKSPNLDTDREWWWDVPVTPNAVWILGSLTFAALAYVVGRAVHHDGERSRGDRDDGGDRADGDDGADERPGTAGEPEPVPAVS